MASQHKPDLSVVVAIVSDTTDRAAVGHLTPCLRSLLPQQKQVSLEILVPYHTDVEGIEHVKLEFPEVKFLPVTEAKHPPSSRSREHHDILRSRGLSAARSDLVALLEDHSLADPGWCASIVAAHRDRYAAIGGAIENGVDRPLNWAVYYCDFGRYQNPLPNGESQYASDANVSYKRSALELVRPAWEHSFREVVVNGSLRALGETVGLRQDIIVYQHRQNLRLTGALLERFVWGRSYAATRNAQLNRSKRIVCAALSPVLPLILLRRMAFTAWNRRRHFGKFIRSIHLIALLQISWSFGEGVGYLTGVRAAPPAREDGAAG